MRPAVLAPLLALAACTAPKGPPLNEIAPEINATAVHEGEDVLVPGDLLAVRFAPPVGLEEVDLTQEIPVQQDGSIQIVGVGTVRAAGRTPAQLTQELKQKYAVSGLFGTEPPLAVAILQPAPRAMHVVGAVKNPGPVKIPPHGRLTVPQAISETGGFKWGYAYLGNTTLVRWDADAQRQVAWVFDARTRWWDEADTVFLQPGDLLFIPDTPVVRVNVVINLYIREMIPFPRLFVYPY